MSEQNTQKEAPAHNLKAILQELQEIDEVLASPENALDKLANGDHPVAVEASGAKDNALSGSMPSMENLISIVTSIRRKSQNISKNTNRLVGN